MLMGAVNHFPIAIVCMLIGAGESCRPFGIAAIFIMFRVMFAQAACTNNSGAVLCVSFGKYRLRAEGKQHCTAEQQA